MASFPVDTYLDDFSHLLGVYSPFGHPALDIATASGAWRAVSRALARIPKQEADQAREAQLARLQALRMLLWNQAVADPIRAAEALIKLEAREARLLGLDMPTKVAVTEPEGNGIPLEAIRLMMDRLDRANLEETVDVTPESAPLPPAIRG